MLSLDRIAAVRMFSLLALLVLFAACGADPVDRSFSRLEPELLSPADGTTIDRGHPRGLLLTWKNVPGADRYMVEIEMQNPLNGVWMPTPVNMHRRYVDKARITTDFPGAQPGRWRVFAINENEVKSRPSVWWRFEFLQ